MSLSWRSSGGKWGTQPALCPLTAKLLSMPSDFSRQTLMSSLRLPLTPPNIAHSPSSHRLPQEGSPLPVSPTDTQVAPKPTSLFTCSLKPSLTQPRPKPVVLPAACPAGYPPGTPVHCYHPCFVVPRAGARQIFRPCLSPLCPALVEAQAPQKPVAHVTTGSGLPGSMSCFCSPYLGARFRRDGPAQGLLQPPAQ